MTIGLEAGTEAAAGGAGAALAAAAEEAAAACFCCSRAERCCSTFSLRFRLSSSFSSWRGEVHKQKVCRHGSQNVPLSLSRSPCNARVSGSARH